MEILESWFLDLEFPRYITQFCRILMDGALFLSGTFRGKVEEMKKNQRTFSKKYVFNLPRPPCLDFFWKSPLCKGNGGGGRTKDM